MSRALTPGDLERLPTWLLEVTYTGRVFRWCSATDGLDLTLSDGTIATYAPGLDPVALVQAASGPSADPDELSIPVEVFFPVDVAELEAEGHALDAASAEVSLLPHGATRNRRRIVLDGQVITPVYGDADEPVAFSIEAQPWDDGAMIPPSAHVVTASTWPQATGFELPDDSIGAIYPGVIGTPGWLNRSPSATTSGSPGIVVKFETATSFAHRLLIAGHRVGASSVVVFYDGGHITGTVAHEQDTLGQECATIDISGEAAAVKESGWYWIGWNSADGGRQLDSGSGVLELAGDVCEWALRQTGIKVDAGRWRAARAWLNRYRLAGYIAESVTPWQWLEENILPLLPVSVHNGSGGLYPVLWRSDVVGVDALVTLTEGIEIDRSGRVEVESLDDLVNEVRLEHGLRARTGDFRAYAVVRGQATEPIPDGAGALLNVEHGSYLGTLSQQRYGPRVLAMSSDWIYGDDVATLIARDLIAARWAPGKVIRYEAGSDLGWLEPGDPVKLTDAGIHMSEQPAIVHEIEWVDEGAIGLLLRVSSQPTRDRRV